MHKKDLVNHINKFLEYKGFKLKSKSTRGRKYVYETNDLFLIVYVDHSSYYEGKYFRYTFGIKELCGNEFDESNNLMYSFYTALEMGYFEPKDYTSDKLYKELNGKYTKYLEPIIKDGLNYICSSKSLISKEPDWLFKKEVLQYLVIYKFRHDIDRNIKVKKEKVGNEEHIVTHIYDEISNIKILEGSFIKFAYDGEDANLNGNVPGLKSFVKVINKLLKRKYNYVRLADTQAGDFYTYAADYFFDYSSNYFSLVKIIEHKEFIYYEDSVRWADKKELNLYISKDKLKELRNTIVKLIRDSKMEKFKFKLSDSKFFVINKLVCEAIRK